MPRIQFRSIQSSNACNESVTAAVVVSPAKLACLAAAAVLSLLFALGTPVIREIAMNTKDVSDDWIVDGAKPDRSRPTSGGGIGSRDSTQGQKRLSKLAKALPVGILDTALDFVDHPYCGQETGVNPKHVTVALAAITYKAPLSLGNSLKSWEKNGLLDLVDEKMLFINAPTQQDRALGKQYGFDIYETDERGGNVLAAGGIAYLVGNSSSDVILFMEKDFELTASRDLTIREMWASVQHMARGVDVYRLRGATDFPAEGMPDCCAPTPAGRKPNCPFQSAWKTAGSFADHMNWLRVYCDPDVVRNSDGRVVQCASDGTSDAQLGVRTLCYSSAESNWSNNPVVFRREWFNRRLRPIALSEECLTDNRLLEFKVMLDWLEWHPAASICSSFQGIFKHVEIDQ